MIRELLGMLPMSVPVVLGLLVLAWWRRSRGIAVVAFVLLWLCATPIVSATLLWAVEEGRQRVPTDAVAPADAILVLSGMGRPARGDAQAWEHDDFDRFLGGYDLLAAGKAPVLMFTGGKSHFHPDWPTAGEASRSRAVRLGVAEGSIVVVGVATTTAEEAAAVRAYFDAHPVGTDAGGEVGEATVTAGTVALAPDGGAGLPWPRTPRVILVTSAFHMARAEALFRKAGLEVTPFPVDFMGLAPEEVTLRSFMPSGSSLRLTDIALHEVVGRAWDWLRGLVG